jgi:hypothetical protein
MTGVSDNFIYLCHGFQQDIKTMLGIKKKQQNRVLHYQIC